MNQIEFEAFQKARIAPAVIRGADLTDRTPRTLIYGYTAERATFHVYLDEAGEIRRVIYDHDGFIVDADTEADLERRAFDYAPTKRAYPERCDLEFCQLLERADVNLSFTGFDETRAGPSLWHGKRVEQLHEVNPEDRLPRISITVADLGLHAAALPLGCGPVQQVLLERYASDALTETFGRQHLLRKFKGAGNLDRHMAKLADSVQWYVRSWAERLGYDTLLAYQPTPDVVSRLRQRITDMMAA